jgi:hypothetical protein
LGGELSVGDSEVGVLNTDSGDVRGDLRRVDKTDEEDVDLVHDFLLIFGE